MKPKEAIDLCAGEAHQKWILGEDHGVRAYLSKAYLSRADLSGATLCGATIDGAVLRGSDIGGPGHILCALTDDEWAQISAARMALVEER